MRTLHRYLLRQILVSLLMTVGVFTFVLLIGNVLKEVLPLLVGGQASLATVAEFVGLLIPYVWLYALPMSVLTATLLVFGRFSADQELTAARAGGISLVSLAMPILLLSLLLCLSCAWINMEVGPRCRKAYKELRFRLIAELSSVLLPEQRFIKDFPGFIIFVGQNRQGKLEDVMIVQSLDGGNRVIKVRADRGRLEHDATNRVVRLHLSNVRGVSLTSSEERILFSSEPVIEIPISKPDRGARKAGLSEMTFSELRQELRDLEERLELPVSKSGASEATLAERRRELEKQRYELTSPIRVQMHRQVAFSFACFGFALVGIPLGVRVQRRETNIGFAVALVLVVIYYAFVLLGMALETRPEFSPHLLMWLPNFLFQAVGIVLLWRANRGI